MIGIPRMVVEASVQESRGFGAPIYAVTRDGSIISLEEDSLPALIVVTNWESELEAMTKPRT